MQQEVNFFSHRRNARSVMLKIVAVVASVALAVTLVTMNATPGHFGYPDTDGCACFVAYTTHPSLATCDQSRPRNCDGVDFDGLLVSLSYLDFNK